MRFMLLLLLCFVAPAANAEDTPDRRPGLNNTKPHGFLSPDRAFGLQVAVRDSHTLQANFKVMPGYHLYRDKISFATEDGTVRITSVNLPKGRLTHDKTLGDVEVFQHSFPAVITLDRTRTEAAGITLNASYQGCSELGFCYPPIARTMQLNLPDVKSGLPATPTLSPALVAPLPVTENSPVSDNAKIARLFKGGSFRLIVSFFFGAGLLLALTPCVFPMIPILSGIIVGRGRKITRMHAFTLSLAYVLGMAITYAAAGVAAGFSGNLISNALQTPWALGSFAAVLVLLSLSMFGFYELQLPTGLQSKLADTSNRLHGGYFSGVFVMGALSAITMGPCVVAPLAGALLYIGQTHDAVLGGVALFALALGMGAPLLLIGASAGVLLPKAGAWMVAFKRFFGVLLLALAIRIIQPLLPIGVQILLWAALLIFPAIYLLAPDTLPHNGRYKLLKGICLLSLLLGAAYLIGMLPGARDILRPLDAVCKDCVAETQFPATLQFSRVENIAGLDQRLTKARGQIVMLDFYADWCVSCKEMERYTFSDAAVQARLRPVLLLQVDMTANSDADQALLKRYSLYGSPAILFFDAQGKELGDSRVTGYQDAAQFLKTLQAAGL